MENNNPQPENKTYVDFIHEVNRQSALSAEQSMFWSKFLADFNDWQKGGGLVAFHHYIQSKYIIGNRANIEKLEREIEELKEVNKNYGIHLNAAIDEQLKAMLINWPTEKEAEDKQYQISSNDFDLKNNSLLEGSHSQGFMDCYNWLMNKRAPMPKILYPTETEIRQLFNNNTDCYADTDLEVIPAITEDKFVEIYYKLLKQQPNIK